LFGGAVTAQGLGDDVATAAELVELGGDARPVINSLVPPQLASLAPDDDTALAAALGDRGDPG
jgi:hypothetical protein